MLEMLSMSMMMYGSWIFPTLLLGFALTYLSLRLREGNGPRDPHVGIKTTHHFFISLGLFVMLVGLTIICIELSTHETMPADPDLAPQPPFHESASVRVGAALILIGGAFALVHRLLLLATNDGQARHVRRAFCGLRLIASGLVVFFCAAVILSLLLQVEVPIRELRPLLAVMIVWTPFWLLHIALFICSTPRLSGNHLLASAEQQHDE